MSESNLRALWAASGFQRGARQLYEFVRDEGASFSLKQVSEFLKEQESQQVSRPVKRRQYYDSIVAKGPNDVWQVDVMIYNRRPWQGYTALLNVVDVYSRKAVCIPLTSRQQVDDGPLTRALREAASEMGVAAPANINVDNEFRSAPFQTWAKQHGVNVWYSDADAADVSSKNAIVERFNRTIASKMESFMRNTGRRDWPNFIGQLVRRYNNTTHSTVKGKPDAIHSGKAQNMQDYIILKQRIKPGDRVRLRLKRRNFAKGFDQTYSTEVYTVVRADDRQKRRWWLRGEDGQLTARPYLERDLSEVHGEVQRPSPAAQRGAAAIRRSDAEAPRRRRAKIEANKLADDSTFVTQAPREPRRRAARPARFRDDA